MLSTKRKAETARTRTDGVASKRPAVNPYLDTEAECTDDSGDDSDNQSCVLSISFDVCASV